MVKKNKKLIYALCVRVCVSFDRNDFINNYCYYYAPAELSSQGCTYVCSRRITLEKKNSPEPQRRRHLEIGRFTIRM